MIGNISGFLGVVISFVLFLFGLINQIKDRNYDLIVRRNPSKRLMFGHKISIWGFYGFLIFFSVHILFNFGLLNNDVFLPGDTALIIIYIAIGCILVGKYLVHSANLNSTKTLY